MKRTTIVLIISLLLTVLFLYAAINKLVIYNKFHAQLAESPYLSRFASFLVWAVPSIEIVIAVLLINYKTRLLGLYGSFFLMLFFTVYIYILLHFAPRLPCGCGGIIEKLNWNGHFYFNLFFTLISGIGLILIKPYSKVAAKSKPAFQ